MTSSRPKPRLLIIGPTPPPYFGVAVATRAILDSGALQEFELLHLDTSDRRGAENIGVFEPGNIGLALKHGLRYLALLILRRPKLVYLPISQGTGGYLRDLLFLLPARWLGARTVVHLRGGELQSFYASANRLMKFLIRYSLARVRRAVVQGASLRSMFAGLVPFERVCVVSQGTEDFYQAADRRDRECIRVTFLSSLRKRKGIFVALDAALEVLAAHSAVEFVFAGEWRSEAVRQQFMGRVTDSGVADRIHCLGLVAGEAKHRLLLQSDIFLFPPIEPEGQALVLLEAMAAGLPVIATPQGAIVDTVVEGETGYLVEPGNARAIADKVTHLLENPERRRRMGQAARRRFLSHYTLDMARATLAEVFQQTLAET